MAYRSFADAPGFARVYSTGAIAAEGFNLGIQRYVTLATDCPGEADHRSLGERWSAFESAGAVFWEKTETLQRALDSTAEGADK